MSQSCSPGAIYLGVLLAMGGGAAINATINGLTGYSQADPNYAYDETADVCFVRMDGFLRVGDTDPLPCTDKIKEIAEKQGNILGADGPG